MYLCDFTIFLLFSELKKLHDETLQHTKDWMEGITPGMRRGIIDHYGSLPETEQDYWTLNDGPTWLWWIINILPIDPKIKVIFLPQLCLFYSGVCKKRNKLHAYFTKLPCN